MRGFTTNENGYVVNRDGDMLKMPIVQAATETYQQARERALRQMFATLVANGVDGMRDKEAFTAQPDGESCLVARMGQPVA